MDRPQSRAYELWDRVGRSFHVDGLMRERRLVSSLVQLFVEEARTTLPISQVCNSFLRIVLRTGRAGRFLAGPLLSSQIERQGLVRHGQPADGAGPKRPGEYQAVLVTDGA